MSINEILETLIQPSRMTRILFILSGMLLLASGARAEIIYMNCKFISGSFSQLKGSVERISKDMDLSIILNKSKKTAKTGNWYREEKYYEVREEIFWQELKIDYTLNTINGNLHLSGEVVKDIFKTYDYQCDKVQKKF